jgi:hypothetical protein
MSVWISGASGNNADKINGAYDATAETCGGWPVHKKRGPEAYYIHFWVPVKKWILTYEGMKAKGASGFAFIAHDGSLESCAGVCKWEVTVDGKIVDQRSVRLQQLSFDPRRQSELWKILPFPDGSMTPLGPPGHPPEGLVAWADEGNAILFDFPAAAAVWQSRTMFSEVQNQVIRTV